jgi:hypothetical protein
MHTSVRGAEIGHWVVSNQQKEYLKMSDYSFVRDSNGEITGFWIQNPGVAGDREQLGMLVMAAMMKKGIPDSQIQEVNVGIMGGAYRVVPNKHDSAGGCFVMLAGARAPGEASANKPSMAPTSTGKDSNTVAYIIYGILATLICCPVLYALFLAPR